MARPRISKAEKGNRERIGNTLRQARLRARLSLSTASDSLNKVFSAARIWQVESGLLPYQGVIGQLAPLYGTTPEHIVKEATGQEFLNFVAAFFGTNPSPNGRVEHLEEPITAKEKTALQNYLQWLRFQAIIAGTDADGAEAGPSTSARASVP